MADRKIPHPVYNYQDNNSKQTSQKTQRILPVQTHVKGPVRLTGSMLVPAAQLNVNLNELDVLLFMEAERLGCSPSLV